MAAGGVLVAIDRVLQGEFETCFALVRPPGHHAEKSWGKGFCLFNNIAIGAHYALKQYGLERILIVDWDLHHGNGTQHSFYNDPRVLFFSTHQYPYYPGTGAVEEIGRGDGLGYNVNVPLRPGTDNEQYVKIFRKILYPLSMKYKPDLVMISAGFDPYYKDPLGGMKVTPEGFAYMARILMDVADNCCEGRLVVTLEGGYHLTGLAESIKAVLIEMRDGTHVSDDTLGGMERAADSRIDPVVKKVMDQINPIWQIF
jgi:acetoin utilization deacetylase AcuC-like enzyme